MRMRPRPTALRTATATLHATLALSAGLFVQAAGCTSGTTPECDDAGSCLILQNPSDAAPSTGDGGGGQDSGEAAAD